MGKTIKIAPSILAADFTRLGQQIEEAENAGADLIHIDVMDGRFVPNITMGPLVVEAVRRVTKLPLDVHLMIVEPERHIEAFTQAGADRITVHVEASPHLHRTLGYIRELNCKAGVALNPHTPSTTLIDLMHMLDQIIVMTVNPGFGGQKFLPETMAKVARLRAMISDGQHPIDLEVDGGVNPQTANTTVQAGANVLIAGSDIFNNPKGVAASMDELKSAVAGK